MDLAHTMLSIITSLKLKANQEKEHLILLIYIYTHQFKPSYIFREVTV